MEENRASFLFRERATTFTVHPRQKLLRKEESKDSKTTRTTNDNDERMQVTCKKKGKRSCHSLHQKHSDTSTNLCEWHFLLGSVFVVVYTHQAIQCRHPATEPTSSKRSNTQTKRERDDKREKKEKVNFLSQCS